MRLYLDDNITDRRVVTQLHRMGHVTMSSTTLRWWHICSMLWGQLAHSA